MEEKKRTASQKMAYYQELFLGFEDEFDALNCLIMLSGKLPAPQEALLQDCYLVQGCQSKAWLRTRADAGTARVDMYSDTLLIRGLMYIICDVANNSPVEELSGLSIEYFERCGLFSLISDERRSGVRAILDKLFNSLL